jgi:acyl transferase domain-containing protein
MLQVIRMALTNAGLHPRELSMLEMHGTGTPLGDPIEVCHVSRIFAFDRSCDAPERCSI